MVVKFNKFNASEIREQMDGSDDPVDDLLIDPVAQAQILPILDGLLESLIIANTPPNIAPVANDDTATTALATGSINKSSGVPSIFSLISDNRDIAAPSEFSLIRVSAVSKSISKAGFVIVGSTKAVLSNGNELIISAISLISAIFKPERTSAVISGIAFSSV